jgi:hypothetical protein
MVVPSFEALRIVKTEPQKIQMPKINSPGELLVLYRQVPIHPPYKK